MEINCGHVSTGAASPAAQQLSKLVPQQTPHTSPMHPGGGDSATMVTYCSPHRMNTDSHLNELSPLLLSKRGKPEVAAELAGGAEHRCSPGGLPGTEPGQPYIHTCIHTCIHTYIHTYRHTLTNTDTDRWSHYNFTVVLCCEVIKLYTQYYMVRCNSGC